jgi:phospholipid:diacylglycerol acyltransferase
VFIGGTRYVQGDYEGDDTNGPVDNGNLSCTSPSSSEGCVNPQTIPLEPAPLFRRSWIDAGYTNEHGFPRVKNGVKMGEGDGTVSLLSLGAMCVEGWKKGRRWNPAGIKVVTVEASWLLWDVCRFG